MSITVYHYPACSTCRKALKWLDEHEVEHTRVHIVEKPPSQALLKRALTSGVPLKKLFNTSGESYKAGDFKTRLPSMSDSDAIKALAADGKLIKRPFVVHEGGVLTGFDEAAYEGAFG
jgi:arsenate reductase